MRLSLRWLGLLLFTGCLDFSLPSLPGDQDQDGDGFTVAGGDCDDTNRAINPLARDLCGDGIDQDCAGGDAVCATTDADRDGFSASVDCDDFNPAVHPAAREQCGDDIDNDCQGGDLECRFADQDFDGFAIDAGGPLGLPGGDCDDTNGARNPAAREICENGIDENCDGGDLACEFADEDHDGYAVSAGGPLGRPGGDCDDRDPLIHPGAAEVPENGVDEDCAPEDDRFAAVKGGSDRLTDGHADLDGDGYSETGGPRWPGGDCQPRNPSVSPAVNESCNFIDDDCSGIADDRLAGCPNVDHRSAAWTVGETDGFSVKEGTALFTSGVHFNVGDFVLPAGVVLNVRPLNDFFQDGGLEIRAQTIDLEGTIDASGAGYGGGGGGGGGIDLDGSKCSSTAASGGAGHRGGRSGQQSPYNGDAYVDGAGGAGGGSGGGAAGKANASGAGAVYAAGGDSSVDDSVDFGSGGGGSGAGPYQMPTYRCYFDSYLGFELFAKPHFGGGSGGAGGGRVLVSAAGSLRLGPAAKLLANGTLGKRAGGREGASTDQGLATGGNAQGGTGSGGGIRLECTEANCLTVESGARFESTGGTGGGGTVKVFCPDYATFPTAAISAGRTCLGAPGQPCAPPP
ncbi:MAG: putative metal-binding motif-containing protein [Myxococcales bacterium]